MGLPLLFPRASLPDVEDEVMCTICGTLLAKGHARTTDSAVLAGYLGRSDVADRALCRFAAAYADQTERDHQALL